MKSSTWTVEGRFERTGKMVTPEHLDKLEKKRKRQTRNLIDKHEGEKGMEKQVMRWKDKLIH